jgi:hypothetical protein
MGMKPEYISLRPISNEDGAGFRKDFMDWAARVKEMQAWCNEQGFNWYIDNLPDVSGVKFQFDWPEDLTLFLLRWT